MVFTFHDGTMHHNIAHNTFCSPKAETNKNKKQKQNPHQIDTVKTISIIKLNKAAKFVRHL